MSGSFLQSDNNAINIDNIDVDLDSLIAAIVSGNNLVSDINTKVSTSELQINGNNTLSEININQDLTNTKLDLVNSNLGTSGNSPPSISGTGIIGWLRAVYEKLFDRVNVEVVNFPTSTPGLTNAELRASPVEVSMQGLQIDIPSGTTFNIDLSETNTIIATGNDIVSSIDLNLGSKFDTEAESDTGNYSLISLFKRLLTKLELFGLGNTLDGGFQLDMLTDLATGANQLTIIENQTSGINIVQSIETKFNSVLENDNETNLPQIVSVSKSHICFNNSSNIPLSASGVFIGDAWQDTLDYSEIIVSVNTNADSIEDGLIVQWSSDGIIVHETDVFTIKANIGKTFSFPCQRRYLRVCYYNGNQNQTSFNLETLLKRFASKGSSHRLKDDLNEQDDAIVTKSLIAGKSSAGTGRIVNVNVNPYGALNVDAVVSSPVVTKTSQMNFKSTYGVSTLRYDTVASGTGASSTEINGEFLLQSGTSTNSISQIITKQRGLYKAGTKGEFGAGVRIPVMPSGTQYIEWGYTDFENSGFYFGVDVNGIYIVRLSGGIVETKIYQSNWNGDKLDGTGLSELILDLTTGVICQIDFVWYGYGGIDFIFYPFNINTGNIEPVTVHHLKVSNSVSIIDPNQPISFRIGNGSSSTSNLSFYVGGHQFSAIGGQSTSQIRNGLEMINDYTTQLNTNWQPLIAIRKKSSFNSRPNSVNCFYKGYEISADGELLVRVTINGVTSNLSYSTPTDFVASEIACESKLTTTITPLTTSSSGLPLEYSFVTASQKSLAKAESDIEYLFSGTSEIILWVKRLSGSGAIVVKHAHLQWIENW